MEVVKAIQSKNPFIQEFLLTEALLLHQLLSTLHFRVLKQSNNNLFFQKKTGCTTIKLAISLHNNFNLLLLFNHMKKSKNKSIPNPINNHPMNINIELNINSSMISDRVNGKCNGFDSQSQDHYGSRSQQEEKIRCGKRRKILLGLNEKQARQEVRETGQGDQHQISSKLTEPGKMILTETNYPKVKDPAADMNAQQTKQTNFQASCHDINNLKTKQKRQKCLKGGESGAETDRNTVKQSNKSKVLKKLEVDKQHETFEKQSSKYKSEYKAKIAKNHSKNTTFNKSQLKVHRRGGSSNLQFQSLSKTHKNYKKWNGSQVDLIAKLEKFKLDVLKLGAVYEESQIFKSRVSDSNTNHVAPKEKIEEVNIKYDSLEEEKIKEMIDYQKKYERELNLRNTHDKVYHQLAPIEQIDNSTSYPKIETVQLIQYYSNYEQKQAQTQSPVQFNLLSSIQPVQFEEESYQEVDPFAHLEKKPTSTLQDFIKYLKEVTEERGDITNNTVSIVENYLKQFKEKHKKPAATIEQTKETKMELNSIIDKDLQINKELQLVQQTKTKLTKEVKLTRDSLESIEDWENRYRRDLLKLKKKMWGEYFVLKDFMNHGQAKSYKQKQQKRLMKCLSQDYIESKLRSLEESMSESGSMEHSIKLKDLREPDEFATTNQYLQTIVQNQLSEDDSSDFESLVQSPHFNRQIVINPQKAQQKIDEIRIQVDSSTDSLTKLKTMTHEQKQDIVELIFLQLVLEFYCEPARLQKLNRPNDKTLQSLKRISVAINTYIEETKLKNQRRKIGFGTNVNTVNGVVSKLTDLLAADVYINDCPLTIRQSILRNLNVATGPTQNEIIRSFRYDIFQDAPCQTSQCEGAEEYQILTTEMFLQFENNTIKIKQLNFQKYYTDDELKEKERVRFLRNAVHVHHKAIFDCFNQILDEKRYFGIWGRPYSWKRKSQFGKEIQNQDIPKIFEVCKVQVVNNCKYACGILVDKQDSLIKDFQNQPQVVAQLRAQRLQKMIENFSEELDNRWFFIDDDEAEISLQLSHFVWRLIIDEAAKDIKNLRF